MGGRGLRHPGGRHPRTGRDIVENANDRATVVVDGVSLPYRPVGIMAYHVMQQELGFQATRALAQL